MVAEGISNVRRHSLASLATVRVACRGGRLSLAIANLHDPDAPPRHFTPRSITERAAALGGTVRVDLAPETMVHVEIPL